MTDEVLGFCSRVFALQTGRPDIWYDAVTLHREQIISKHWRRNLVGDYGLLLRVTSWMGTIYVIRNWTVQ